MPQGRFLQRLTQLVNQGLAQNRIALILKDEGLGRRFQLLRGLINRLRGRRATGPQQKELGRFGLNISLGPTPTAVEVTARIMASYRVVRDQLTRSGEVLLSGMVSEEQSFVLPITGPNQQTVENQALARLEEEVNRRVQAAGLAQAGNYLLPEITSQSVEILSTRFTDFQ